jgi:hypothetical protein
MGFFGFIENFFFISLALVFALVLLLVYHFKNRIAVAEKKSESMYGLLTAVVKEIKSLRGMFGLGSSEKPSEDIQTEITQSNSMEPTNTPSAVQESKTPSPLANLKVPADVIHLDFSASECDKIVVSDGGEDDSSSEDEEDEESDDEEDADEKEEEQSKVSDIDGEESTEEDEDEDEDESDADEKDEEPSLQLLDISAVIQLDLDNPVLDISEFAIEEPVSLNETSQEIIAEVVQPVFEEKKTTLSLPSIEQLRKMNINQLKTVASQLGLTADMSKMKKNELITIIQDTH